MRGCRSVIRVCPRGAVTFIPLPAGWPEQSIQSFERLPPTQTQPTLNARSALLGLFVALMIVLASTTVYESGARTAVISTSTLTQTIATAPTPSTTAPSSSGSTTCVQGQGGAPCPSTSSITSQCTIVYPAGESWTFLRVVYDSNLTPVAGAQVTVTSQGTAPTCYGSSATTTERMLTFITNSTEWHNWTSQIQRRCYSIVVTYSGHSYSVKPSEVGPPETSIVLLPGLI
jgi:hypothetical protein